ncbi:MAG: ABC transporter ATP-binding protein [Trueperaceae bacterium]|nr:ABC transporter ATP-binding protein [Trueperaceae bacterium]
MSLLTLEHVTKSFGNLRAVHDVSLEIPKGKIIGLIGPNGSGKSTLLNVISALNPADSGRILFEGEEISKRSTDEIFGLGLVRSFQDPSLFFKMTVLDNSLLPVKQQQGEKPWRAPFHHLWRKQEAAAALESSRLLEQLLIRKHYDALASDLSGGQMKLLELGRSLMGNPKLLLLDEPTAGVAPKLAYTIFENIAQMRENLGLTFLIVEHRLEILFDFVDSLYVMHMGQVLTEGSPAEISANSAVREIYFGE